MGQNAPLSFFLFLYGCVILCFEQIIITCFATYMFIVKAVNRFLSSMVNCSVMCLIDCIACTLLSFSDKEAASTVMYSPNPSCLVQQ